MIATKDLQRVVKLADHGHFGRAAKALGITQPALSRSIEDLERRLGAKVFDRGRWGLAPTDVGELLIARGRLILQQGRDLEDEIERLRGLNTGRLEITLGPYAAETTGHRSIARLVAQHEHIRCRIRVSDWRQAMKDVLDGRSEMALTDASEVESKPDLQASPVFSHPMYFFCRSGHEILRLDTPQLSDLAAYPWAATRAPARIADFAPREMGRAGSWEESTGDFVTAIALEVAHDIASIAVASDVIAVAPITMIEQELRAGTLVLIPIAAPWLRLEYALLARANRTRSAVALAFAKLLSQVEDELRQQEAALQARYAIS